MTAMEWCDMADPEERLATVADAFTDLTRHVRSLHPYERRGDLEFHDDDCFGISPQSRPDP